MNWVGMVYLFLYVESSSTAMTTPETESSHVANFVVTGGSEGYVPMTKKLLSHL